MEYRSLSFLCLNCNFINFDEFKVPLKGEIESQTGCNWFHKEPFYSVLGQ